MPLSETGKKVRRSMHSEYGKEKGDRVFYSMEHSHPEWTNKAKAEWWADRIGYMPTSIKAKLLEQIKTDSELHWWLKRVLAFRDRV